MLVYQKVSFSLTHQA